MRLVLIFTIIAVFSSSGFSDEAHDHGIRRPKESGIARRTTPKSKDIGLSGELIWVKDLLILQTPSGKKYALTSSGKELEEKLLEISEKKNTGVDLAGTLSDGKFKVKEVELVFSNQRIEKGSFTIGFSENDREKVISALTDVSGVELEDVSLEFLIIKSDLSEAQLKNRINEVPFLKKHVNDVQRTTVSRIALD